MNRPDNVNESIGFIKGYSPHSGEIIEQYLEKLESQLDTITKNLGGYKDSDPVSLSENIGIWNKELSKRLDNAIKLSHSLFARLQENFGIHYFEWHPLTDLQQDAQKLERYLKEIGE